MPQIPLYGSSSRVPDNQDHYRFGCQGWPAVQTAVASGQACGPKLFAPLAAEAGTIAKVRL
jgi:hypothetical protein